MEEIKRVCSDCGNKYGDMPEGHVCTWCPDFCDICGEQKSCAGARDFGYVRRYKI